MLIGFNRLDKSPYSQDAGYPPTTGAQNFPAALIHGPFATQAEDGRLPRPEYTRTTSGRLLIAPDPPATPAYPHHSSREEDRAPRIPVFEHGPMELRRPDISDLLDPFWIESVQPRSAVGSGTHTEPGGFSSCTASQQKQMGQGVLCTSAGIHPTIHRPGRGKPDRIGEEVETTTGNINRVE